MQRVHVIGGGLAGSEAAWQLADRGIPVTLVEMRPATPTGAHRSDALAEVVCTNSFKSMLLENASGLLKAELGLLGCHLIEVAKASSVPAGHALAVDRDIFSAAVTRALEAHPLVTIERRRQDDLDIPKPAIIATGPLTGESLSVALSEHCSSEHLYFYDAIAPSLDADTIPESAGYWASRYGKGEADYLNIPLDRAAYQDLLARIEAADLVQAHEFEKAMYFEACLPVEVLVSRGEDTLRYGPLKPRGLPDPRTGRDPYAVIQLRQESRAGTLLGMVGFQTRMTYPAQREVIRSIPGLETANILRYGSIHRNIFLDTPQLCSRYQRDRRIEGLYYAGQICGVEGYVECIMSGLVAALSIVSDVSGRPMPQLPAETMIGSLMEYIHRANANFQPMNSNMGVLPSMDGPKRKRKERYQRLANRAVSAMEVYRRDHPWLFETPARPVAADDAA